MASLAAPSRAQSTASLQITLGNPSGATTSTTNENNYLMQKPQFAMSYNRSSATPNWVSWHLGPLDLGSVARSDSFHADTALPSDWYRVTTSDYTGAATTGGITAHPPTAPTATPTTTPRF